MRKGTQSFFRLTRTLHIYLTMFSAIVLFVFALTGFMLNHGSWFGLKKSARRAPVMQEGSQQRSAKRLSTPPAQDGRSGLNRPDKARAAAGSPDTGRSQKKRGLLVKLTNLHKGKPSSLPVVLLIDVTAAMLMLGSITGVIMLLQLPRRRRLGLALMGVGTIAGLVTFLLMMP